MHVYSVDRFDHGIFKLSIQCQSQFICFTEPTVVPGCKKAKI